MTNTNDQIVNQYFKWIYQLVCGKRYAKDVSYVKLLSFLHSAEFTYSIPMDKNRAADGVDFRRRFALLHGYDDTPYALSGPCSVLEMMVALAVRCEETIMDDPRIGDRTGQWFWNMIVNLGLGHMQDSRFDKQLAIDKITTFLNREYEPNGKGGLFSVRHRKDDMRKVEIWYQLNWYLNEIV